MFIFSLKKEGRDFMYKINPKHTIKNCRNYGENYNDFTKYMLRIIRLSKYKGLVFINNIETNIPTYVEIKISEKENLEYLMKSYNSKQSLDILKTNLKKDNQGKYKKIWIMWETLSLKFKEELKELEWTELILSKEKAKYLNDNIDENLKLLKKITQHLSESENILVNGEDINKCIIWIEYMKEIKIDKKHLYYELESIISQETTKSEDQWNERLK